MGPRSTSRSTDDLVVGLIRGPHGVHGEVRVDSRTDVANRFKSGAHLLCDGVGDLVVARARGDERAPIVAFRGYDDREHAETLSGRLLRVPREASRRAAEGAYLWADLVGLAASRSDGTPLGTVTELIRAGAADVLVLRGADGQEVLVPMIGSVVKAVDVEARTATIDPLEELDER